MKTKAEHGCAPVRGLTEMRRTTGCCVILAGLALLPARTPAQCVPPVSGLVSWWRAEGDAVDRAGNNPGALNGGLGFGSGEAGQAFNFTADGQAVTVPASASLNVGSGPGLTVEGWINPTQAATQLPVAEWNSAGSIGAHLWISVSYAGFGGPGAIYASLSSSLSGIFASAPGVIQAGVWQHIALTYEAASGLARLYRDGAVVASTNLGSQIPQTSANLYLGARPGVLSFRGRLDEFSVYNRALSSAEILAIHDSASAGKCPALTRTVTSLADSGAGSLRAQLAAAGSGDTISFAVAGTITLTSGELVINKDLTIAGPGASVLTIDANNASRIFRVDSGRVLLSGLVMTRGHVVGNDGANGGGAHPDGWPGDPGAGAGVFNYTGNLTLSNCAIIGCSVVGGRGGANDTAGFTFRRGGVGGAGWGGAIYNGPGAVLSAMNCTFRANTATGGIGGMGLEAGSGQEWYAYSGGDGGQGAGAGVFNAGLFTATNCTFYNDGAFGGTGGRGADRNLGVDAGLGGNGGIVLGGGLMNTGTNALVNCTAAGNLAVGGRGGDGGSPNGYGGNAGEIYAAGVHSQGQAAFTHCTIAGNTVIWADGGSTQGPGSDGFPSYDYGHGLTAFGSATRLLNTLVVGNRSLPYAGVSANKDVVGSVASLGHNLAGVTNGSFGWVGTDLVGSSTAPVDARLGPATEIGDGLSGVVLLIAPDSRALDAGDDSVLGPPMNLSTDQRGFARKVGAHVDIGAVELEVVRFTAVTYARPWLISTVPSNSTFLALAMVSLIGHPLGGTTTLTATYELRDETNGLVSLQSNSVSLLVQLPASGTNSTAISLPLVPVAPFNSVDHSYKVVVTVTSRDTAASPVVNHGTLAGPAQPFLYFDGRLRFGPRVLNLAGFAQSPTPETPVSGSYVPVTLRQVRVVSPNVPGLDFVRPTMGGVRLQLDGDAVYSALPFTQDIPGLPPGVLSNVSFMRTRLLFGTNGISADPLTVKLPAGFGYNLGDANGPVGRVLQPTITLGTTSLDDFLRPEVSSLSSPAGSYYFCEETKPLWMPGNSITWFVNEGRFQFTPTSASFYHVRTPEYTALTNAGALADEAARTKLSNDRYYESVNGMANPVVVRAGANQEALMSANLSLTNVTALTSHFPYNNRLLGSSGGSSLTISNDLVTGGQLGVDQGTLSFDRDCPDVNCSNAGNGGKLFLFNPPAHTMAFTPEGGLLANVGFQPQTLEWGAVTNGVFVHSNSTTFNTATYHMPGTFLRGDLATAGMDDRPGILLLSGYGQVGNDKVAYVERPDTPDYKTNGLANYAGLNFLVGGLGTRSRSTIAGKTLPDYPLSGRSKYYVRAGGVSGIHEPVPGTFPTNLVLYGYDFTFSSFGLAYRDNEPLQEYSIANGSVAVPYPSGFTQDFSKMQISCRGELTSAELPPGAASHLLQYWGNRIRPLAMDFRGQAGQQCNAQADRTLSLAVETYVAHVPQALHGVLGFTPGGKLVPPAANIIGVDSRFDLPPNLTLRGPSQETYNFTTVAKGYLNNYDGAPSLVPGSGWMNLVGKIDLPFFEDARVHLHTSGKSNDNTAPIFMMGGWLAPEDSRSQLGWTEGPAALHYFNTLTNPAVFDRNNWGYPKDQGVLLTDYHSNADGTGKYHPRAVGTAFNLVPLDYPLDWSSTTRAFKSYRGQTNRILVVDVASQVKRMTPRNAEITFGAEYSGLPKISIGRLLADGLDEATGVFRSLNGVIDGAGLQNALGKIDRVLSDRFDGFLGDALNAPVVNPVVEQLCAGIYGATGGASVAAFSPAAAAPGPLTGEALVNFVNAVLYNELQQRLTNAIQSTGAGSVIATVNDIVGEADKVLNVITNITARDKNGVRTVGANIVKQLVDNEALQFAATVADYELLFDTMQKIDPTLDDILSRALAIKEKVHRIQAEVNGGFRQELYDILSSNVRGYLGPLATNLVDWVNSHPVPTQTPTPAANRLELAALPGCAGPVPEQFRNFAWRRMLELLAGSPIASGFQVAVKQRLQDVNAEIRETLDTTFQQLNEVVRDLLDSALAELDKGIASFAGDISDVMGAGQIQGYASINDDGLRKLRLDGKFRMKVPDSMEFRAYLEILALNSEGSSGCSYPGNNATEVKIGALNVPLDWISKDMRMDLQTKFTSDSAGARGFAGALALRGKMKFEVVELSDLAATIAFGKDEAYFGGRARARLNSYEVAGGLWFGKSCDEMPLKVIDPTVEDILPKPGPYVGGYAYAEGWLPINEWLGIPSTCLFTVRGGIGAGMFFFESGQPRVRTYGGKALIGADIELLCIAHARLAMRLAGGKVGGDFILRGRGDVDVEIGSCPFCIEFSKSVNIKMVNGSPEVEF